MRKIMKRVLVLVMTLCMAFAGMSATDTQVYAKEGQPIEEGVTNGVKWQLYDDDTVTIVSVEDSDATEINIPETINDCPVVEIYCGIFDDMPNLTKITLPDTVTELEASFFAECETLKNVKLPSRLTSIEDSVFYKCSSLESIEIPSGVTNIGESAFAECSSLNTVKLSTGLTDISESAFYNCDSLENIEVPNEVTNIGESAFAECSSLKTIKLPGKLTMIEKTLFYNDKALESIAIPIGVVSISDNAFDSCEALNSVTISNTVQFIGNEAFEYCHSLKNITIPDSVTTIGQDAFYDTGLKGVTLSKNVNAIGDNAFGFYAINEGETETCDTVDGFVITGYDNTEAQKYASENTLAFTCLDNPKKTVDDKDLNDDHLDTTLKNAKKATYFAKGYTGDEVCDDCGKIVSKGKTIVKKTLSAPSVKAAKKKIVVKYSKITGATAFQIRYRKAGGKWITKKYKGNKACSKTFKKLKSGKKYSVQFRVTNGKVYSVWSKTKTVKVK